MKFYTISYFSYIRAILAVVFLAIGGGILWYLIVTKGSLFLGNEKTELIIIDQSLSMAVEDIHSDTTLLSRLDLAKKMIDSSLDNGNQVGIISYAKNPKLVLPISQIHEGTREILYAISPETELGGSDFALALGFAKNLYGNLDLTVLIYTDGGSTSTASLPSLPKNWKVRIYGIGTKVGGKIPLGYNSKGERRYKYFSGSEITVPYDENTLLTTAKNLSAELMHSEGYSTADKKIYSPLFQSNTLSLISIFFILLGLFITPYGRKKQQRR